MAVSESAGRNLTLLSVTEALKGKENTTTSVAPPILDVGLSDSVPEVLPVRCYFSPPRLVVPAFFTLSDSNIKVNLLQTYTHLYTQPESGQ